MKVSVTSDSSWEAKVDHAMRPLDFESVFEEKDYGSDLAHLGIVVICRSPDLGFKQRVRYNAKDRVLYLDVMLDLRQFVLASHAERRCVLAEALMADVPRVIEKRKFKEFDLIRFKADFLHAVKEQLLGVDAARFDSLVLERATGF
jgi:hypothetical protein